jgi:hypothetical protein
MPERKRNGRPNDLGTLVFVVAAPVRVLGKNLVRRASPILSKAGGKNCYLLNAKGFPLLSQNRPRMVRDRLN